MLNRFRMRNATAIAALLSCAVSAAEQHRAGASTPDPKPGYWFYKAPPPPPTEGEKAAQELGPPPPEKELLAMHPKQFEKLLEEYRQYALWKMEPETVRWYYQMQDFARRRSRAFMNVTEVVMLQNPGLNMQTVYPTNPPGQNARVATRERSLELRLQQERGHAALILLERPECGFCAAQSAALKYFQQKHGWDIRTINLNERPDVAARFATDYTPTTVVIFRNSDKWMPVAVGVETVQKLEENIYRAVRMIRGETSAQQFSLQEFNDGSLLDPQRSTP